MNIFIPVRLNSKRLPNKPLKLINNLPLLHHTYNQVLNNLKNINYSNLYILCEDPEIIVYCMDNYIPYINTSENNNIVFKSGTDRVAYASNKLNLLPNDLIVNVQGDMFTIPHDCFNLINDYFNSNQKSYWATLITDLKTPEINYFNPNIVKCINQNNNNSSDKISQDNYNSNLSFFRTSQDKYNPNKNFKHIGIYIYKNSFLQKFTSLNTSQNEEELKLEQLRGLDNGYHINGIYTKYDNIAVDCEEDLNNLNRRFM